MIRLFSLKARVVLLLGVTVVIAISLFIWQKYPFGVKQYRTIVLGMQAAQTAGTYTTWAPPDHIVPESLFYVYALNDEPMCIGSSCGMGGYFIECLGGWLAGEKVITEEFDYGLREAGVDMEKQKIITIADKDARIIGIYPGASIKNLPYIMRNHRNLVSQEIFDRCSNLLPRRWK